MAPYYQDDAVTIYHGDCREILPQLHSVDLVLTDPPWPMSTAKYRNKASRVLMAGNENAVALWASVAPLIRAKRMLVWFAIHNDPRYFLNPLVEWPYLRMIYIRRAIPGYFGRCLMDGEQIHALGQWPAARKGRMVLPGGLSITYRSDDRDHDHPGPRSLIATRWLLNWWSDPQDIVLDPFMGSGTTLRAAKDLGRKAIGIEIEEKYCEISAKRMKQQVFNF